MTLGLRTRGCSGLTRVLEAPVGGVDFGDGSSAAVTCSRFAPIVNAALLAIAQVDIDVELGFEMADRETALLWQLQLLRMLRLHRVFFVRSLLRLFRLFRLCRLKQSIHRDLHLGQIRFHRQRPVLVLSHRVPLPEDGLLDLPIVHLCRCLA